MPFLEEVKKQFSELIDFFAQQTKTTKSLAGGILAVLLLAMAVMVFYLAQPREYELLFGELSAESAIAVKEDLESRGIEPEIENGESSDEWTIKVPKGMALELRLEMMSVIDTAGGKVSWSIFDTADFGTTSFRQNVKLHRATKGGLELTIQKLEMVRDASVELSIPEKSGFMKSDEIPPTASVVLTLEKGMEIGDGAVRTIQNLVAGSIEGLTPENVTVADTLANNLSLHKEPDIIKEEMDQTQRLIDIHRGQREDYENALADKIVNSFSQIFGKGHVTADVSVEFDYTKKEDNSIVYDGKNPVSISRLYELAGEGVSPRLAVGLTGTAGQIPPEGLAISEGAGGVDNKEYTAKEIENNLVGETKTKTVYSDYQIKTITASVMVDNLPSVANVLDDNGEVIEQKEVRTIVDPDGIDTKVPNSLTDADIEAIESVVKGIINYHDERPGGLSDYVYVFNKPFSVGVTKPPEVIVKEKEQVTFWRNMRILGWILFLIVAVVFIGWPLTRIVAPKKSPLLDLAEARAPMLEEERVLLEGEELMGGLPEADGEEEILPIPMDSPDQIQLKQEELDDLILELARGNPKKVPLVFRSWVDG